MCVVRYVVCYVLELCVSVVRCLGLLGFIRVIRVIRVIRAIRVIRVIRIVLVRRFRMPVSSKSKVVNSACSKGHRGLLVVNRVYYK